MAEEKQAENVQLKRAINDQNNDLAQLQKQCDELKDECDKQGREAKKIVTLLKQKQDELAKLTQASNVMKQENRDVAAYAEKLRNDNDRITTDYDRIKVL